MLNEMNVFSHMLIKVKFEALKNHCKLKTTQNEKNLSRCMYFMRSLGLICPGSDLAERHQILYPGFSKPGHYNHRSTIFDHRKFYTV